jgi:GxxExxY protein
MTQIIFVLLELKAISKLGDLEMAQVLDYLRATGLSKGLLLNFGAKSLELRRLIMSPDSSPTPI